MNQATRPDLFALLHAFFDALERGFLALLMGLLILSLVLQAGVELRLIPGANPLAGTLLMASLWLVAFGAARAMVWVAHPRLHFGHWSERWNMAPLRIGQVIGMVICFWLSLAMMEMVRLELRFQGLSWSTTVDWLGWLVMAFAFALSATRLLALAITPTAWLKRQLSPNRESG